MEESSSGILIWIPFLQEKTDVKSRNKRTVAGSKNTGDCLFCPKTVRKKAEKARFSTLFPLQKESKTESELKIALKNPVDVDSTGFLIRAEGGT